MSEVENQEPLILYSLITTDCGCFGWLLREQRVLLFQIWYQVTAAIWLALAVTVAVLVTRLLKLNKLKMKSSARRSEKPWITPASFSEFFLS